MKRYIPVAATLLFVASTTHTGTMVYNRSGSRIWVEGLAKIFWPLGATRGENDSRHFAMGLRNTVIVIEMNRDQYKFALSPAKQVLSRITKAEYLGRGKLMVSGPFKRNVSLEGSVTFTGEKLAKLAPEKFR